MRRAPLLAVLGLATIACVSIAAAGEVKPARFSKRGCGAIFDTRTGLAWYLGPDEPVDAHEARAFVDGLTACGGDWRMPMMKELEAIREPNKRAGRGFAFQGIIHEAHLDPLFAGIGAGVEVWAAERAPDGSGWVYDFHLGIKKNKPLLYEWRARAFAVKEAAASPPGPTPSQVPSPTPDGESLTPPLDKLGVPLSHPMGEGPGVRALPEAAR
ncbi:MAG: hypothetical protein IT350_04410 [Deltaproteobacteria bacterium]|nr:hypothetical protein [Deltaproteobacteria bacterium]